MTEHLEGGLDVFIGQQRAHPVAFEGHQPLGERIAELLADKIPAELAQNVDHWLVRVPAEAAPNELIDVVIDSFRVGQKADSDIHVPAENIAFLRGPRVRTFASLGERISHVPIGDRELGVDAVGDVGIMANRKLLGNVRGHRG